MNCRAGRVNSDSVEDHVVYWQLTNVHLPKPLHPSCQSDRFTPTLVGLSSALTTRDTLVYFQNTLFASLGEAEMRVILTGAWTARSLRVGAVGGSGHLVTPGVGLTPKIVAGFSIPVDLADPDAMEAGLRAADPEAIIHAGAISSAPRCPATSGRARREHRDRVPGRWRPARPTAGLRRPISCSTVRGLNRESDP